MRKLRLTTFISLLFIMAFWQPEQEAITLPSAPTVEVRNVDGQFMLYRHDKPYKIKGVGGHEQMDKIALYGGNSIRTWSTQNAAQILDEAHSYGLTVTLGLEVGKEWWGEEFSYWNFKAIDQKIADLKKVVEQHKDHPALLIWNVGNEVQLFGGNKLLMFYTIDRIAKMVKETDPNHPVMTSVHMGPLFDKLGFMQLLIPNVDILGVNTFIKLYKLQEEIREPLGWRKVYIITEWGPPGPWEVERTSWGAPIEPSSSEKAEFMKKSWQLIQEEDNLCLGSYAFYWGTKYERTYTFFSLLTTEGHTTEAVNVLRSNWTNDSTGNQAPKIDSIRVHPAGEPNNLFLVADSLYQARIYAHDPDNDCLSYYWEIRPEGYDNYIAGAYDYPMNHLITDSYCEKISFRTPEKEGGYRIAVYVYDGQQHVATHNLPFYVMPDKDIPSQASAKTISLEARNTHLNTGG